MANVNKPFGFKAVRNLAGAPYNGALSIFPIAYNYNTAMYVGDAVKLASGKLNIAAITDPTIGIFAGVVRPRVSDLSGFKNYWPANGYATLGNQDCFGLVVDDPNVVFEVQFTGFTSGSTVPALANVSSYFKASVGTAGSAVTGLSGQAMDAATVNTAVSGLVWKFLRFVDRGDNDTASQYARGLFQCTSHVNSLHLAAS